MTTTNNNLSLTEMLDARSGKLDELKVLLTTIKVSQNAIESSQKYLNSENANKSYFAATAGYHVAQIEKQVEVRNNAVNKYNKIMWTLFKADLPLISNTAVQECATTLYTPAITKQIALS